MQSSNIEKEDGDVDGPFDLGVAITEKLDDDKETQIVYYSTANLMESQVNQMVSGGNEKLLLESLNWMTSTDDSNSVSIPSKSLESTSLTVTDYDAAFWKICTIGLIPGVFLVAGFLIWLKRKSIMKKSTKLVSAVVVLAVLGGVYVGLNTYVSKEEKTESSEEESKTEVFSMKTDDIKSLEFIVDKKEVTFEKKDDSWVKKDETAFPVNQTTLDSAASAIEKVEADRVLEDVEDLTEYGLDSPSNTVTVDTADGTTKLNIGDENYGFPLRLCTGRRFPDN